MAKDFNINKENMITVNEDMPTAINCGYFELKKPINKHITWGTELPHLAKS